MDGEVIILANYAKIPFNGRVSSHIRTSCKEAKDDDEKKFLKRNSRGARAIISKNVNTELDELLDPALSPGNYRNCLESNPCHVFS